MVFPRELVAGRGLVTLRVRARGFDSGSCPSSLQHLQKEMERCGFGHERFLVLACLILVRMGFKKKLVPPVA